MSSFVTSIVDIGIVVRNLEASIRFYRDAIGFEEVSGFEVSEQLAGNTGLTDGRGFMVRVLQLPGDSGTKIKLVELPEAPLCCDARYLHSVNGMRYMTVRVADIDAAVEKAVAAGARISARGPVEMPPPSKPGTFIAVVRDPDNILVELIGRRRS